MLFCKEHFPEKLNKIQNQQMKIIINDDIKISGIQEEFNKVFPYLKLEFFSGLHNPGMGSAKRFIKNNSLTLGDCRRIHTTGNIIITPVMTVTELEQCFGNIYGLGVQVFRQSGKTWLETSVTDGWTLEEQNRQGEELSKSHSDK